MTRRRTVLTGILALPTGLFTPAASSVPSTVPGAATFQAALNAITTAATT